MKESLKRVFDEKSDREGYLQIAHRLINGPRQGDYDHPLRDFTKTAFHWTGVLFDKLKPGCEVDALDVALMMASGLKCSREVHRHKDDNQIDGAGYYGTIELIVQLLQSLDAAERNGGEPMHPRFRMLFERMGLTSLSDDTMGEEQ